MLAIAWLNRQIMRMLAIAWLNRQGAAPRSDERLRDGRQRGPSRGVDPERIERAPRAGWRTGSRLKGVDEAL